MPLEWIDFKEAVRVYHLGQVAYTCGVTLYHIHGGYNAVTGRRSVIEDQLHHRHPRRHHAVLKARAHYIPPLSNQTLFARDAHLCLYCGGQFHARGLSRDHIKPLERRRHRTPGTTS